MKITLASLSPRRRELLSYLGIDFDILNSQVNEDKIRDDNPHSLTQKLATAKAEAAKNKVTDGLIIGSDTVVYFQGKILEKAKDKNHQRKLIKTQRGKKMEVITSVCILDVQTNERVVKTKVTSCIISNVNDEVIESYIEKGTGLDKAGGIGYEDENGLFIKLIDGCFSNVMGFPLCNVAEILKGKGIDINENYQELIQEKTGHKC